ncbi:hypothetical protein HI914_06699 [Erysiphe necator]|uniref:Uncharacterized protein n=1 Tax=Uncinula necator TaxID=52586 RepID=A0A0B1P639_UNCNE|nr:hypothetical protein HI914_06699 [Erysiphe necator]KHJ32144.1 hypothetical protein EV44_g5934 [Erysiphe necator]
MATIEDLEAAFANHPSLNASLQDFEVTDSHSGFGLNARAMHSPKFSNVGRNSGIRSDTESDLVESVSGGLYSPPAWRWEGHSNRGSGFWKQGLSLTEASQLDSRENSPEVDLPNFDEDETLATAARTRLPTGSLSPEKRRSPSPEGIRAVASNFRRTFVDLPTQSENRHRGQRIVTPWEKKNNYIRFSVRAEVQHKTEPLEAGILFMKRKIELLTSSWLSLITSITVVLSSMLIIRSLFQPAAAPHVPDLVKVAGLARAFEPLIFYSENGIRQIGDLQATGIAVWDLGESVRVTNMTSAEMIVTQLDDLSESLKNLAIELSRFFANVDGDVDGILIVMDWARRELSQLQSSPPSSLTTAFDNMHMLLRRCGILETSIGTPTQLGAIAISIFGPSNQQRIEATLQKTFHEFLSVLEEAINTELTHSLALFSLFSAIDHRFHNLARTVARELNDQEDASELELSRLWSKIMGPDSKKLHKFEKNKNLLGNIRNMTFTNKGLLEDHNRKLLTLKANLENLRRKIVSPLLRGNESTIGIMDQIRGLEEVSGYLGGVREKQRGKLMEMLYGAGRNSRAPYKAANLGYDEK